MNFNIEKWTQKDKNTYIEYLESIKNEEKIEWIKNIVCTNMNVLAIKSPILKNIIKEIRKGDYISFLDLQIYDYYECMIINAGLISKIKDFELMEYYLNKYVQKVECWASTDTLSFNIKGNEEKYLSLVKKYIKSENPFIRRTGIIVLFKFLNYKEYLKEVFNILDLFYSEENYYVNMVNAWLLCECFIKNREETMKYLDNHNLNKFTINKAISKCRDSYRVSSEDKEMLLKYKKIQ